MNPILYNEYILIKNYNRADWLQIFQHLVSYLIPPLPLLPGKARFAFERGKTWQIISEVWQKECGMGTKSLGGKTEKGQKEQDKNSAEDFFHSLFCFLKLAC
jgi:hypothetical protein